MRHASIIAGVSICAALACADAGAETTSWFAPCQTYTLTSSGVTSDTINTHGYLFTYTRDKLFTGGTGQPIGRSVRVPWPGGIEAQAVTTPPPGITDYKARVTVQRADGQVFDFTSFTFQLLANTAGAGASLEIMPMLNGEDGFADPIVFDATGNAGNVFTYDRTPNPRGSTILLTGFDTYKIALYVDFALIGLAFDSVSVGPQSCCLGGGTCSDLAPGDCALQGGTPQGAATSCSCNPCAPPPPPPPVPDGRNGTWPVTAEGASGGSIQLTWDVSRCLSGDYNLLYGNLASVRTYALNGAVCSLGTSGTYLWSGVPAGNLFFLIAGTDGAGTEGSWGLDSASRERHGAAPSGLCGVTAKSAAPSCP